MIPARKHVAVVVLSAVCATAAAGAARAGRARAASEIRPPAAAAVTDVEERGPLHGSGLRSAATGRWSDPLIVTYGRDDETGPAPRPKPVRHRLIAAARRAARRVSTMKVPAISRFRGGA